LPTETPDQHKNRLISEVRTGTSPYSAIYAYAPDDSRLARDLPSGGRVTFTHDLAGKITADSAGTGYSWDADGRLLHRIGGIGPSLTWAYDYAGRVTSFTLDSGNPTTSTSLTYLFDGDGRLQRLRRKGNRSAYLLDGRDVLREWNTTVVTVLHAGTGAVLRPRDEIRLNNGQALISLTQEILDYTHGASLPLSPNSQPMGDVTGSRGLVSQRTTQSQYYRWDGRGTARRMEDSSRLRWLFTLAVDVATHRHRSGHSVTRGA
jgi:hypothetical protein